MKENPELTKKNILESARAEFLEKGFSGASLRSIAANANVTTGAMYCHFRDKDALFCAIVDGAVEKTIETINTAGADAHRNSYSQIGKDHKKEEARIYHEFIDYVYDNFDVFTLLLMCAAGSSHASFLQEMADLYSEKTLETIKWFKRKKLIQTKADDMTIHVISSNFILSIAEIVLHKMPKAKALQFLENIRSFFTFGWDHLLGIPCE